MGVVTLLNRARGPVHDMSRVGLNAIKSPGNKSIYSAMRAP